MQNNDKNQSAQYEGTISSLPFTLSAQGVSHSLHLQPDNGLTEQEFLQRKKRYGINQLPSPPQRQAWQVFIAQFKSVLILIVAGAAALSAAIGNVKDAAVILAVMLINASLGFYQEWRAEQSLLVLKEMLPLRGRVRRDGQKIDIPATALVPGDLVLIEAGDLVPADGRLWFAAGLEVDESALTGESRPATKQSDTQLAFDTVLADRSNMVYLSSVPTFEHQGVVS